VIKLWQKIKKKSTTKLLKSCTTDDIITGRGGLFLIVRYISKIKILEVFEKFFGDIRKSMQGANDKKYLQANIMLLF
jgi:uncharacterized membrane protein